MLALTNLATPIRHIYKVVNISYRMARGRAFSPGDDKSLRNLGDIIYPYSEGFQALIPLTCCPLSVVQLTVTGIADEEAKKLSYPAQGPELQWGRLMMVMYGLVPSTRSTFKEPEMMLGSAAGSPARTGICRGVGKGPVRTPSPFLRAGARRAGQHSLQHRVKSTASRCSRYYH